MRIKAVAYARVSTSLGQDVENQIHGIREFCTSRNLELIYVYSDEGISGVKDRRPALDQLVMAARQGKFKILVVSSIDRLGRSVKHLLNLLDELNHYGVSLISLRENLDFSSPVGQMALTMLASVAQLERALISERIRVSLAVKKAKAKEMNSDWKTGRPAISQDVRESIIDLRSKGLSIREISKKVGKVSKTTVSRVLKEVSQKR